MDFILALVGFVGIFFIEKARRKYSAIKRTHWLSLLVPILLLPISGYLGRSDGPVANGYGLSADIWSVAAAVITIYAIGVFCLAIYRLLIFQKYLAKHQMSHETPIRHDELQ